MSTFCPACGSDSIETTKKKHMIPIVYGNPAVFDEVLERCLVCEESGDFSGANDELIDKAIEVAKKQSVIDMLDALSHKNIKMSYMERALELPTRTIARWKGGELSAATLALLRIIRTFPWILEVADAHFDQSIANYRLVEEAAHVLHDVLKPHTKQIQMNYDNENVKFYASLTLKDHSFPESSMKPKIERMPVIGGDK
ncbi:MAG: hypothetical protein WAW61_20125 [Methylococcaceae bacterium]